MITVRDFKGRLYDVIEHKADTTLLRCVQSGSYVRIRSYGWDEIGFVKP